jgi:hypothetical protein
METPLNPPIAIDKIENSFTGLLIVTVILIVAFIGFKKLTDVKEVVENWEKYRCNVSVMPFASFYGKDAQENFSYCMNSVFMSKTGAVTGPFASILTTIVGTMMQFIQSLNSLRLMLGTLFGGVSKVFQEFTDRFKFLYNQIRVTSVRMQFLFKRLFTTFISIIFMGTSAITAGMNFGDTFLFNFLDTFCFDPDTLIDISGRGKIAIKEVNLGDVCSDGSVVTSSYRFYSHGQEMVNFTGVDGPITVSTNHYIRQSPIMSSEETVKKALWIRSEEHDDATLIGPWVRHTPLVCLDTNTHHVPIGGYVFSDYDETNSTDTLTMRMIDSMINNMDHAELPDQYDWPYMPCLGPRTNIRMKDGGLKPLYEIKIGDQLSTGIVIGLVYRSVNEAVVYNETIMTPSTLVWTPGSAGGSGSEGKWIRAGFISPVFKLEESSVMIMPLVMSTSTVETEHGVTVRDLMEIMSHDIEGPTEQMMLGCAAHPKNNLASSI